MLSRVKLDLLCVLTGKPMGEQMKALLLGTDMPSDSNGSVEEEDGLDGEGEAEAEEDDSFADADAILNATHSVLDVSTPAVPAYDYGIMHACIPSFDAIAFALVSRSACESVSLSLCLRLRLRHRQYLRPLFVSMPRR